MVRVCSHLEKQPDFRTRNTRMDTWYDILHRQHRVDIGGISERLEHKSSFPGVHNDRFRNRLVGAKFRLSVFPRKSDEKSVKRAQAVENLGYHLFNDLTRKRTNILFAADERTVDYQCWAGIGFQRIDWTPNVADILLDSDNSSDGFIARLLARFKKAEKEGFPGNPFVLESPSPQAVFHDENFSTVCQVGEHQVSALLASYEDLNFSEERGFWFASDALPAMEGVAQSLWDFTAKLYVLETEEFVYEVVAYKDGVPTELNVWPNWAERPRYSIHAGHITSAKESYRRFRPLIHPLYALAQERNILKTLLNSGALMTGRPLFQEVPVGSQVDAGRILSDPGADDKTIKFELEQGLLSPPRDGYQWVPMGVPESQWLEAALSRNEQEERDYGFPAVLSPSLPLDATSGFDRSQQKEAGSDFLDPPLMQRAQGWRENLQLMFDQLQGVGIPISFTEKEFATGGSQRVPQVVKPEFFEDIDMEVRFESIPASVAFAEREMMRREVEFGVTAKSTYAGILHDDPVAENERAFLDKIGEVADDNAATDIIAAMQAMRGELAQQMANEAGIPLQAQGKNARPPGGSFPGVGSPVTPPPQDSAVPSQNAPVQ